MYLALTPGVQNQGQGCVRTTTNGRWWLMVCDRAVRNGLLLEGVRALGSTGLRGQLMLFRQHQAGTGGGGDDSSDEVGSG
ncbi:hypothetical protein CXB51_022127 [Gossypium anomalum]|uniref:Uncharacterized protein n=1 Tax=Gossypium anomalum TaxID=47600 RepID=A0A8J6CQ32_9ROSI|nr:hypothetical protein CXB51_022127 [Gossypium anomalum]